MGKEIAIIIPAYNAQDYISNLMYTIQAQTYIEKCKIIIINDNDNNILYNFLYDEFSKLDIVILKTKASQSGPGAARNVGLKYVIKQNIPYIIFADADDIFYSTMAIEILYKAILEHSFSYIYSPFFQEREKNIELNNDEIVWLFGKIYKTSNIKKYNIFFFETFLGEDQSFNLLYWLSTETIFEVKIPLYLQKENLNSLTHNNEKITSYNYFLTVYEVLYKTFLAIKKENFFIEKFKKNLPERIIRMYLDYNRDYTIVREYIDINKNNLLLQKIYQEICLEWWKEYTQEDWLNAWKRLGCLKNEIPNIGFFDFLQIMTKKERGT